MLSKLRPRSIYDVFALLGLLIAMGGTGAYAANTIRSSDIVDGEIGSADVKDNSINTFDVHSFLGVDVVDGSLEDQDVGQGTFVNFATFINFGDNIPPHSCITDNITGINAQGDHLLLTPNAADSIAGLQHSIAYQPGAEYATLKSCNITASSISVPTTTHFNLLVFDAQ